MFFFFFLVHTYRLEITHTEEQRGLDIAMGGIFLKAQVCYYYNTFFNSSLLWHIG